MEYLDNIFKENEGKSLDSIDRKSVRRNFILYIIKVICDNMYRIDFLKDSFINYFLNYKFINDISITDCCVIKYYDDNDNYKVIRFDTIPDSLSSNFFTYFYDHKKQKYDFSGKCHSVVFKYLDMHNGCGLYAITSLCEDMNNRQYFHSYLWNKEENKIIDFSRNIIMNKDQYDELFCHKEINVMSYDEIAMSLSDNYCSKYCRLLYLALIKLYDEKYERPYHKKYGSK